MVLWGKSDTRITLDFLESTVVVCGRSIILNWYASFHIKASYMIITPKIAIFHGFWKTTIKMKIKTEFLHFFRYIKLCRLKLLDRNCRSSIIKQCIIIKPLLNARLYTQSCNCSLHFARERDTEIKKNTTPSYYSLLLTISIKCTLISMGNFLIHAIHMWYVYGDVSVYKS